MPPSSQKGLLPKVWARFIAIHFATSKDTLLFPRDHWQVQARVKATVVTLVVTPHICSEPSCLPLLSLNTSWTILTVALIKQRSSGGG